MDFNYCTPPHALAGSVVPTHLEVQFQLSPARAGARFSTLPRGLVTEVVLAVAATAPAPPAPPPPFPAAAAAGTAPDALVAVPVPVRVVVAVAVVAAGALFFLPRDCPWCFFFALWYFEAAPGDATRCGKN